jgi:hypothetical protein
VHVKTSVWCLLDGAGRIVQHGKTSTTAPDLTALVQRLIESLAMDPDGVDEHVAESLGENDD